jgi:hypothetical protein
MVHVVRGLLSAGVLAVAALLVTARPAAAQDDKDKGEGVRITTVDGVTLHGRFYPCAKKDAPVIIFLHKIGDKGLQKNYMSMAAALQPDYAVMLFDFRGHGKSKEVNPADFWKNTVNLNPQNIRGAKPTKTTIEYSEFSSRYLPVLVNDIAAVKAYLDRKNDNRECNTSSTILIGAESGATLGAIWLNSQWSLVRMIGGNVNNPLVQATPSPNPEGKDVIACIWMSMDSQLGKGNTVSLAKTLQMPVAMNACPTVFMYGDANETDKTRAHSLIKTLKPRSDDKKFEFVVPYGIAKTNLRGISLAQKSLGLEKIIRDYLEAVVDKKGGEWGKCDFRTSAYMWRTGGSLTPAKMLGPTGDPNNLMFNTYEQFIGR